MTNMVKWGPWFVGSLTVLYAVLMLAYEFMALANKKKGDTISEMVWAVVYGRPVLSAIVCIGLLLAFGLLMGHFFWQVKR